MSNKINPPHGLESFFSLVDLVSETIAFLLKKKHNHYFSHQFSIFDITSNP